MLSSGEIIKLVGFVMDVTALRRVASACMKSK
jgi:hypothetical protein